MRPLSSPAVCDSVVLWDHLQKVHWHWFGMSSHEYFHRLLISLWSNSHSHTTTEKVLTLEAQRCVRCVCPCMLVVILFCWVLLLPAMIYWAHSSCQQWDTYNTSFQQHNHMGRNYRTFVYKKEMGFRSSWPRHAARKCPSPGLSH